MAYDYTQDLQDTRDAIDAYGSNYEVIEQGSVVGTVRAVRKAIRYVTPDGALRSQAQLLIAGDSAIVPSPGMLFRLGDTVLSAIDIEVVQPGEVRIAFKVMVSA